MLYKILKVLAFFVMRVFFNMRVSGRNNIPKKGGFIIASNHRSFLDPIALGVACSRRLNFMARHDLFRNRIFARFISLLGAFPLKRNSADLWALKEAMRRLKKGGGLLLFPEGTRGLSNVSLKSHPGVGFLASKVGVPIVPAFISGTDTALPKGAKFIRPARVYVRFGKQICVERRMPYQDIAQLIMNNIRLLAC